MHVEGDKRALAQPAERGSHKFDECYFGLFNLDDPPRPILWDATIAVDCPMAYRLSIEIKGDQHLCYLDTVPDVVVPRWRDLMNPEEVDRLFADIRIVVGRSHRTNMFDKRFRVGILVVNTVALIVLIMKAILC